MRTKKPTTKFWAILAVLNVLAVIYPVNLVLGADGDYTRIVAMLAAVAIVLFLALTDTISIVIAYNL